MGRKHSLFFYWMVTAYGTFYSIWRLLRLSDLNIADIDRPVFLSPKEHKLFTRSA